MMEARYLFNPCEHQGLVYLCGGGTVTVETFRVEAGEFSLLDIRLPEKDSGCLVDISDSELVIRSKEYVTKWSLSSNFSLLSQTHHPEIDLAFNMTLILSPSQIYVCDKGRFYRCTETCAAWVEIH